MLTQDADTLMRRQIDAFETAVGPFVEAGEPFALLDFPDHPNVGDSAIYIGELEFFDKFAKRPASYVCSISSYRRDIDHFCAEGPLFIHGGGNFGSIWRKHQAFRYDILENYRHRKVIQLAQSVHYGETDDDERNKMARLIDQHPDFTLLVRDKQSFEFVEKHFSCAVHMCPDAAHNMWKLDPATPKSDVFSLMRDDKETSGQNDVCAYLKQFGPIDDWRRQIWARSPVDRVVEKVIAPRLASSHGLMRWREAMYRKQAWYRVRYGVRLLSTGKLVVSDRLHAHLLSSLMRKPHICLDNYYGKIARYIDAWGHDDMTQQVTGLEELMAALKLD
jgi:exopolysaccharide biosynthesis predicted pyruvyltransferase EpsI